MHNDIEYILLNEEEIDKEVSRVASEINKYYEGKLDSRLVVVGILNGSVVFLSDLIRKLNVPLQLDFIRVSSYGTGTTSGEIKLKKGFEVDLKDRYVLIVEDIVDTGRTLSKLKEMLKETGVKDVKIATLLDKPDRRLCTMEADFLGRKIPDEFVVGYGLDYSENYRQLPYIGVLKREVYTK